MPDSVVKNLTSLFINTVECSGDVPPPLIGSSLTYLNGKAYLFGGRTISSGALSSQMYACDLQTYTWRKVGPSVPMRRPQSSSLYPELHNNNNNSHIIDIAPSLEDYHDADQSMMHPQTRRGVDSDDAGDSVPGSTPYPRFFHSATAYMHYIVIFGGMSLACDKDMRYNLKVVLNDIAFFDTIAGTWLRPEDLMLSAPPKSGVPANPSSPASSLESDRGETGRNSCTSDDVSPIPAPRYAHVAFTVKDRHLVIIGGQDAREQYLEEINVFDLRAMKWSQKMPFSRNIGLYRSTALSTPHQDTLLFSNYNFSSVKRTLYRLNAPPRLDITDLSSSISAGAALPPGLRFPSSHLVDPHTMLLAGTNIAGHDNSELSLWLCNLNDFSWRRIQCAQHFMRGSWNQSVLNTITNEYVAFGDSNRDLAADYQRRRLNFNEAKVVDLKAFGCLSRDSVRRYPIGLQERYIASGLLSVDKQQHLNSYLKATQELGMMFHTLSQFVDCELTTSDGEHFFINSGMLRHRLPQLGKRWLDSQHARKSLKGYCITLSHQRSIIGPIIQYIYTYPLDMPQTSVSGDYTPHPEALALPTKGAAITAGDKDTGGLATLNTLGSILVSASVLDLPDVVQEVAAILHHRMTPYIASNVFHWAVVAKHSLLQAHAVTTILENKELLVQNPDKVLGYIPRSSERLLLSYIAPTLKSDGLFAPLFEHTQSSANMQKGTGISELARNSTDMSASRSAISSELAALAARISDVLSTESSFGLDAVPISPSFDLDRSSNDSEAPVKSKVTLVGIPSRPSHSLPPSIHTATGAAQGSERLRIMSPQLSANSSATTASFESSKSRSKEFSEIASISELRQIEKEIRILDKGIAGVDHLQISKSRRRKSSMGSPLANEVVVSVTDNANAQYPRPNTAVNLPGQSQKQHPSPSSSPSSFSSQPAGPRVPSTIAEENPGSQQLQPLPHLATLGNGGLPFSQDAAGYHLGLDNSPEGLESPNGSQFYHHQKPAATNSTPTLDLSKPSRLTRPTTSKSHKSIKPHLLSSLPTTPVVSNAQHTFSPSDKANSFAGNDNSDRSSVASQLLNGSNFHDMISPPPSRSSFANRRSLFKPFKKVAKRFGPTSSTSNLGGTAMSPVDPVSSVVNTLSPTLPSSSSMLTHPATLSVSTPNYCVTSPSALSPQLLQQFSVSESPGSTMKSEFGSYSGNDGGRPITASQTVGASMAAMTNSP